MVLPQLKPVSKSNCTCTELFLIQKSIQFIDDLQFYDDQLVIDYSIPVHFYLDEIADLRFSTCLQLDISDMIEKCEFNRLLRNCQLIPSNCCLNTYSIVHSNAVWRNGSQKKIPEQKVHSLGKFNRSFIIRELSP